MITALLLVAATVTTPHAGHSPIAAELASARAREAYFGTLERQSSIINDGPAEEWGEGTAFPTRVISAPAGGVETRRYAGHWPFEGFIPRPVGFPVPRLERPAATIEWRRQSGTLVESFIRGHPDLLRRCRQEPAIRAVMRDARVQDWSPPKADDPPFTIGLRTTWATCWVDAYELSPGGPLLLIGYGLGSENLSISIVGLGPRADGRVDGDALSADILYVGSLIAGMTLHLVDLDRNGSRDAILAPHLCGTGGLVACPHEIRVVLTDIPAGRATITSLEGLAFDLIDLDRNGRAELLLREYGYCERCTDGKPHAFDITQLLGFRDLRVVDLRDEHVLQSGSFVGRFPAFEWMAFGERDRFRDLLTSDDRDRLAPRRWPCSR